MEVWANGVHKSFGHTRALIDVSLRVESGEVVGLVGSNGAGKTTLLRVIGGLSRASSGQVRMANGGAGPITIGVLPADPGLYGHLDATSNIGVLTGLRRAVAAEALERAGLDSAKGPVRRFSKGMKQRLGLCVATVGQPDLLLLDEPATALDQSGVELLGEMIAEASGRGSLVLLASHDAPVVERVATRILVLRQGMIAADLTNTYSEDNEIVRMTFDADEAASVQGILEREGIEAAVSGLQVVIRQSEVSSALRILSSQSMFPRRIDTATRGSSEPGRS